MFKKYPELSYESQFENPKDFDRAKLQAILDYLEVELLQREDGSYVCVDLKKGGKK